MWSYYKLILKQEVTKRRKMTVPPLLICLNGYREWYQAAVSITVSCGFLVAQ